MSLKNGIKSFISGGFRLGKTASQRLFQSYDRKLGVIDGLAGAAAGFYTAKFITASCLVIKGASIALVTAAGPGVAFAAAGAICLHLLYLGVFHTWGAGFSLGLLDAAREKANLPSPVGAVNQMRYHTRQAVTRSVEGVKKLFKPLTSLFNKSSNKKPPSDKKFVPVSGKKFDF